jgi:hypothetical protein
MEQVMIEGTLDKVETIRKKDGVTAKLVLVWVVRDFTKITKLSQMQNAIVKVTVEDPQQDLYEETMANKQTEMGFDEEEHPQESPNGQYLLSGHEEAGEPGPDEEVLESVDVESEELL